MNDIHNGSILNLSMHNFQEALINKRRRSSFRTLFSPYQTKHQKTWSVHYKVISAPFAFNETVIKFVNNRMQFAAIIITLLSPAHMVQSVLQDALYGVMRN